MVIKRRYQYCIVCYELDYYGNKVYSVRDIRFRIDNKSNPRKYTKYLLSNYKGFRISTHINYERAINKALWYESAIKASNKQLLKRRK